MNKAELIENVAQMSGIDTMSCSKVLKALEQVLSNELENSKGRRGFFDVIYRLMSVLRK